ncbi:hypothetical protein OQA88_11669 [Cercophora sp. LCS_1]
MSDTIPPHTPIDTPTGQLSHYTLGTGPSLLIIHGAVSNALTHLSLAHLLSPNYTVHLYSRRSRGLSSSYPPSILSQPLATEGVIRTDTKILPRAYSPAFSTAILETDVSDLETVISATKAECIIAVSSGALVALQYLLTRSARTGGSLRVKEAVLFEPPIFFTDRESPELTPLIPRFEAEWEAGDVSGAMITSMKAVQLGPWWIPRWIARGVMGLGGKEGRKKMEEMGRSLRFDFAAIEGMVGDLDRFKVVSGVEVLLLGGEKSPVYLGRGLEVLAEVFGRRVVLKGVGHEVLCGREMRGCPERAVGVLREFFG